MKRVFVFQDFKSQKFWSIDVVGTDVTVNYGKLVRHKSKTTRLLKKPKKLPINLLRRKQRKAMWKQQRKRHAR